MLIRLGIRGFHRSCLLHEKTVIPSVILSELNDTGKLATHNKQKQIFLKPNQIIDRRFDRIKSDYRLNHKLKESSRQPTTLSIDDETVFSSITSTSVEDFKPNNSTISQSKHDQLKSTLIQAFTAAQLGEYLNSYYQKSAYCHLKKSIKTSKSKLIRYIIRDIWKLTISDEALMDDLLITSRIPLSKTDLFLLLSENGFIIQYLSRVGVQISLDPTKGIQFVGTESQVRNAEIMLNSIMLQATRETLDLSYIKKLFLEKYNEFLISKVIKNTEVYFENVSNDIYDLLTLNSNQIKRAKRLLVWLLNYNQHIHNELLLSNNDKNNRLVPYKDDEALSWNTRLDHLYKLQSNIDTSNNKIFQHDLLKFSPQMLNSTDFDNYRRHVNDAKNQSTEKLEKESWDLLNKMGMIQEGEIELLKEEPNTISSSNLSIKEKTGFSKEEIQKMHQKLINFEYRKKLFGQNNSDLNQPIITITLGNILFEGKSEDNYKPNLDTNTKYQFNSNIPFINDQILSLPLYNNRNLSIQDQNLLLNNDPHTYAVQIKFLPSPYEKQSTKHMNYPPVELWVELNDRLTPDIETLEVVTVEGENNLYVSMPDSKADMKICCQLSGKLLVEDEINEDITDPAIEILRDSKDVETILDSISKRYSKFKSQPGISKFLKKSKLNFSGKSATSINPHIDIIINGETVRYHYINLCYRRQLELVYGERLIQFNIVEGGSLGGRRIEINIIGDLNGDISLESFIDILSDARSLLNSF